MINPGIPGDIDIPDIDLPDLDPVINPVRLFDALRNDLPLLMLPVRLETRFFSQPDRLRIRIYPDQIHVNGHQPELSEAELRLGQKFWEMNWQAGKIATEAAAQVFGRLADKLGVWRAAWVMEATTPVNLQKMGEGAPVFPPLEGRKNPAAPARLALLPGRWLAVGLLDGQVVFVEAGEPIPQALRFAPFQMQDGQDVERWIVDFETALRVGMALEIRLNEHKRTVASRGLDELFVIGIRAGDPVALAQALEDTLRGHYYTHGFDFVPQGTPTNNTESVSSPWPWNAPDADAVFWRAWQTAAPAADSFGQRFAGALGLDSSGIVARAVHGDLADTPAMEAMNRILWYITWGEYLRFVLHDGESAPLADDSIDSLRDWFSDYVRGGAVYPAFHIGAMPYGVLPVKLNPRADETALHQILRRLRAGWVRALPNVPHLDPTATDAPITTDLEAANDHLIALLSSHPHPVRFYSRHLSDTRTPIHLEGFADPTVWLGLWTEHLLAETSAVDPAWSYRIAQGLQTPFDSLAAQQAYFADVLAETAQRLAAVTSDRDPHVPDGDQPGGVPGGPELPDSVVRARLETVKGTLESIVALLDAHADRISPVNSLGLPPLRDVLDVSILNPEHFYFQYDTAATAWGDLPLVQAPDASGGATAAVYLGWLRDYALEQVSGSGPDGLPDPPPLLFQLIRQAVDRASAWGSEGLVLLDQTLVQLDQISKSGSVAVRVNATRQLAADQHALEAVAQLLEGALHSKADDPTRKAIASVPAAVLATAAAQLSEYQQMTNKASPALTQTVNALNEWVKHSSGRTQISRPGGTHWLPIEFNDRTRGLANSIGLLAGLDPAALELRLAETLGLAMHRLDAWITAYAEQQVDTLRAKTPGGIQIGGYGWVENLRRQEAGASPSQGYVHAPSLSHAAAAAVLRSGYSAYSDGTSTSPMSVDLRSDRVRVASWMMDGVRQGQRINDLLGYRFERFLHDALLDIWIAPVRDAVRQHGTTELADSGILVTVDGLALLELWDEGQGNLRNLVQAPVDADGSKRRFDEIVPALEHLVWITDSMADMVLAESVHALVQGDYERATAVQTAAALGDVPPPELRSILTPNSGMTLTHRILLLPQAGDSAWNHNQLSIRSQLEPALESWAAGIIGPPDRVRFQVQGGPDGPVEDYSLADLPLSALDTIYLAPAGDQLAGSGLGALITFVCGPQVAPPDDAALSILIHTDVPTAEDQISLAEFLLLAHTLQQTLSSARAASRADFLLDANEEAAEKVNTGELLQRAAALVGDFRAAVRAVRERTGGLEQALLKLSFFNLPQAIPAAGPPESWAEQAATVLATAHERLQEAEKSIEAARQNTADLTATQRVRAAQAVIAAVLGRDYPVMPRFRIPLPPAALRDEAAVAEGDVRAVMGWLLKMARVRPELYPLRDTIMAAEALQDRALLPLWVAQVPHHAGEPWAGLVRPGPESSDRLSVILTTNGSPEGLQGEIGGLVLDQWIERIPSDYEMTGLAFHYDAPTSRPPQVLLLAVPPAGADWDFSLVLNTVREAFALTRLRAVAPETLGEYGHHLPAVYLNADVDTMGAANG